MAEAAAATEPVLDEDPPDGDPRAGSSVTGMSGLSDLMLAEPNLKSGDTAVGGQPPPIREAKFASTEAAQNLTQSAAHLRHAQRVGTMSPQTRRMAILVIALLAFGVAIAGIGLVLLSGDDPSISSSPTTPAETEPGQNTPSATEAPITPAGPPIQPGIAEPGALNHDAPATFAPAHAAARSLWPLPLFFRDQGGVG